MNHCKIKGCKGKYYAKGLCRRHYNQRPEVKEKQRALRVAGLFPVTIEAKGYSKATAEALVLDGQLLTERMKKRGILG